MWISFLNIFFHGVQFSEREWVNTVAWVSGPQQKLSCAVIRVVWWQTGFSITENFPKIQRRF